MDARPLPLAFVSKSMIHALESTHPRTRYVVGWDARATWFLKTFVADRFLDGLFALSIGSNSNSKAVTTAESLIEPPSLSLEHQKTLF